MATEQVAKRKPNVEALKKALEELRMAITRLKEERVWDEVYSAAEDIIAYIDKRMERFALKLLPHDSNEMYVVYIHGIADYASYHFRPETSLKQLVEHFFDDAEILTRMIRVLAIRVTRAAEETVDKIRELGQRVKDLEFRVRNLELKDEDF